MTAEICEPVPLALPGSGRNVAEHVQRLTGDLPASPTAVVVQGPGGTGKTVLLAELASSYRRAGATVVDGLEILVQQGALSYQGWTGLVPDLDLMREAAHRSDAPPSRSDP